MNIHYLDESDKNSQKVVLPSTEIMVGELVHELLRERRCVNRRAMISRLLLRLENVTCPMEAIYYAEILNMFEQK
ncbi:MULTISPECIES: hypothetical protein [Erwiniaceae]|uniref:hypothetical protein n=1 Tax=Erwiniaceae TaxID=1903409 RepID=UPI0012E04D79|nr:MULTISPECIES: hypothetical protein [Erwiniaceae]MBK0092846.1 hypothetical protein [Erwinia sp. S59]MBK0123953.1 hypothetical protein [Pantoea sp. S61]